MPVDRVFISVSCVVGDVMRGNTPVSLALIENNISNFHTNFVVVCIAIVLR